MRILHVRISFRDNPEQARARSILARYHGYDSSAVPQNVIPFFWFGVTPVICTTWGAKGGSPFPPFALGIDLQVLVHQDMRAHFSAYPSLWGLRRPDPNIDHRRVFNLMTFFTRHGQALRCSTRAEDYQPGDIVAWRVQNQGHIGIVSSRRNWAGSRYLVVHNIGRGQVLEDMLFSYPIIGHYRYQPDALRPQ